MTNTEWLGRAAAMAVVCALLLPGASVLGGTNELLVEGGVSTPAGEVPIESSREVPMVAAANPATSAVQSWHEAGAPGGEHANAYSDESGLAAGPSGQDPAQAPWPPGSDDQEIRTSGPGPVAEVDSSQAQPPPEARDAMPEEAQPLSEATSGTGAKLSAGVAPGLLGDEGASDRILLLDPALFERAALEGFLRSVEDRRPSYALGDAPPPGYVQDEFRGPQRNGWNPLATHHVETNSIGGPAPAPTAGGELPMEVVAGVAALSLALLLPALYSRMRRESSLDHATRAKVYELVRGVPGLTAREIGKRSEVSYSTAVYHLSRLVREGLVTSSRDGNRICYYTVGSWSLVEREVIPVLRNEEAMRVLQTVADNPWCYRAEVAAQLGVSTPTVNWHLKRLLALGLVREVREGRVSYLYADKELLAKALASIEEKAPGALPTTLAIEPARPAEPVLVTA
ncbi:MAG TPA: winged helix-turn-helix transcriptional regulator [Candidatus Thermoplasmatota archaeon]|nr:winged helix-turn-helix transcriptional regulator [Candidatus Thermoplasmatota archaeon]